MRGRRTVAVAVVLTLLVGALLAVPGDLSARSTDAHRVSATGTQDQVTPRQPIFTPLHTGLWPAGALDALGTGTPAVNVDAPGSLAAEDARQELIDWIDGMLRVYPYLADYGPSSMEESLLRLRSQAATMTPEQIAAAKAEIGSHPGFWEFPEFLRSLFETGVQVPPYYAAQMDAWSTYRGIGVPPASASGLLAVPTPNPTPVPYPTFDPFPPRTLPDRQPSRAGCPGAFTEDTCDECPDGVPLEAVFAAKVVALIAGGLNDASGTASQDVCAPPGVGFTVPNFVKYIFLAIKVAADATQRSLDFSRKLEEECEGNFHNALIDTYLDETVSSRLSQASLDDHSRLMLHIEIENNLLNQADDRISLFQLPESVCGDALPDDDPTIKSGMEGYRFCGQLELVRDIVDDTIAENAAAGMTPEITQARNELAAGDNHYGLRQWKSAYERYSKAYRYAVMQPATR
jgi:hypothetical protein